MRGIVRDCACSGARSFARGSARSKREILRAKVGQARLAVPAVRSRFGTAGHAETFPAPMGAAQRFGLTMTLGTGRATSEAPQVNTAAFAPAAQFDGSG